MRSIRMRLLLSVGSIFLIICLLIYYIPRFFVTKDINSASTYLNTVYGQYQRHIKQLAGSLITYRFVDEAAKLAAVSQMVTLGIKTSGSSALLSPP